MATKTFAQIVASIAAYIKAKIDADTSAGTVIRDISIDGVANELATIYTELVSIGEASSLSYASTMSEADMDALAYNWNVTRKAATKATGTVIFTSFTEPASPISIVSGTVVSTRRQASGSTIDFITTEGKTLSSSDLDSETGYYSISVPVEATVAGTSGNVVANMLTVLASPIVGVDQVTNELATSGGTEKESNADLAVRVLATVQGVNIGTSSGYKSKLLEDPDILDVSVVGPTDPEMTRNIYGGSIDVYLLAPNPSSSTSQAATYYTGQAEIALLTKPVLSITSVTGTVLGASYTFSQDTDYSFSQDTTSVYAYSTKSFDKLVWLSGTKPDADTVVTITYNYDRTVRSSQDTLDLAENHIITADVLTKYSTEVLVEIELTVSTFSGYSKEDTKTVVETEITNNVNALLLGETLQYSDVVSWAYNVAGVDEVVLPFTKFQKTGETPPTGLANITATKYEYLRLSSLVVTVT